MSTEQVVTLVLPVRMVNLIISGLAELPFKLSGEVIGEIKDQADADLKRQADFLASGTQMVAE